MTRRFPLLLLILLPLAACELGLSVGYNLPRTDSCRQAHSLPGKPLDPACLDAIGGE
jgi:hypothetical protein